MGDKGSVLRYRSIVTASGEACRIVSEQSVYPLEFKRAESWLLLIESESLSNGPFDRVGQCQVTITKLS